MAYPGLRRQMNHGRKAMPGKRLRDRRTVGELGPYKFEALVRLQDGEARLFQRRIVIGIEIVEANDAPALGQQGAGDVESDEARCTRHQYRPIRHLINPRWPLRAACRASLPAARSPAQYPF